jgi:hypothetical protein
MTIKLKEAACAGTIISQQGKLLNVLLRLYECGKELEEQRILDSPNYRTWGNFKKQLRKCEEAINGHGVEG